MNTFLPDEGKSSNADCKQCSEGRTTGSIKGSISESKCLCQKEISYYQASDASCKPCPSGADCSLHDGITVAHLFAQPGYWRRSNSTPKFQSCADAYYSNDRVAIAKQRCCPNGQCNTTLLVDRASPDHQCLTGYQGPLCMTCADEYLTMGSACVHCPGGANPVSVLGIFASVCVVLFLSVLFVVVKTKTHTEDDDTATVMDHITGEVSILISWAQVVSAVTVTFNSVSWPEDFSGASQTIGFVNLDLSFLLPYASCNMSLSYAWKLLIHASTPVACVLTTKFATFVAIKLSNNKSQTSTEAKENKGHSIFLTLLLLLYPSLTTKIFTSLRCFNVEGVGEMLERDFSIECWKDEHALYITVAVLGMVVYALGIPMYLLYDLWKHHANLHDKDSPKYHQIRFK